MNRATISICVEFLYEHESSFLLGKYLGVCLQSLMISICLTLYETAKPFSRVAVQFCILTSNG